MCSISGIYSKFSINHKNIYEIGKILEHRGPDNFGYYHSSNEKLILMHNRLSIIDLSPLANQPMLSIDNSVVIVFNGEIYNFSVLRIMLSEFYIFKTNSDTEVIINLYLFNNRDFFKTVNQLDGIFSLALFDNITNDLWLSRDHFGIKPLYFCCDYNLFAFSSEIKGLLPLLSNTFDKSINKEAILRYLTFLWCPGSDTPFLKIHKLNPGELVNVNNGKLTKRELWYNLPIIHSKTKKFKKLKVLNELPSKIAKAVSSQMVSDVPLGAFLSGGLDSSTIVNFARNINPNIDCFSINMKGGQDNGFVDDLPYAKVVAKHLNVNLNIIDVDSSTLSNSLVNMVSQLDEPLADPAPIHVGLISSLARNKGIKVLLSGAGGDDIFSGYLRHKALVNQKYFQWIPKFAFKGTIDFISQFNKQNTYIRRIIKYLGALSLDGNERLIEYFRWIGRNELQSLFTKEFYYEIKSSVSEQPMIEFLSNTSNDNSDLAKMLALEQRFFLTDHNLIYTDKMSMAHGVEVRVPFLDKELVEFASHIPDNMLIRNGETKWILKKVMEPYLPHDIIYRPKTGFGAPIRRWMRFELRELLLDVLSFDSLNRRGIFDPVAVEKLMKDTWSGKSDGSYTLLSLLCIELWFRRFIDNTHVNQYTT